MSPTPYHRLGTPYRKVDLPGTETEVGPETVAAGILAKPDDSFEVDSESERNLIEEPKTVAAGILAKPDDSFEVEF